jgi:hypothetical protein
MHGIKGEGEVNLVEAEQGGSFVSFDPHTDPLNEL